MYDKIKILLNHPTYRYIIIGGIGLLSVFCCWYIFHEPNGSNNNDSLNTVERIERQQRESVELNRDIQRSIDRGTVLSHEAKGRIERSTQYNQQIGERINASQTSINEARNCLVRNAELFDRVERANRQRQENNQTLTNATQPIPNTGSGGDNRSSNSSMTER
nr:MAG TPA: Type II secretion system, protein M [Caudoviricetes sp.]